MNTRITLQGVTCTAQYSEPWTSKDGSKSGLSHYAVFEWSNFDKKGNEYHNGIAAEGSQELIEGLVNGAEYEIEVAVGGFPYEGKDKNTGAPVGRRAFTKLKLWKAELSGQAPAPAQKTAKPKGSVLDSVNHTPGTGKAKIEQPEISDDDLPF